MSNFAITFTFEEIFPTQVSFTDYCNEYNCVDVSDSANLIFAQYCYKFLYRTYCGNNIQYDTIEDFKLSLANVMEDYFSQFRREYELVKDTYLLTNEDIVTLQKAIDNQANNPNNEPANPLEPISFISNQTYSVLKQNDLEGLTKAINRLKSLKIKEFTSKFSYLFKSILIDRYYIYN